MKRDRASRNAIHVSPFLLQEIDLTRTPWHESAEEIREGIKQGAQKAVLLAWVRRQMGRRLTKRERHCIELYYFEGMTFRQVGEHTETNASSACRAVQRALRKLRVAAQEDDSWRRFRPSRSRRRG